METQALRAFLSEDTVKLHASHLSDIQLKYSVIKKSIPELNGKTLREIMKMRLGKDVKDDILPLINSIKSHIMYFSSFALNPKPCNEIRRYYSSEAAFLYEMYLVARETPFGFLYISLSDRGTPIALVSDGFSLPSSTSPPRLAIDLCEHAYFLDYHFDKDRYLRACLSHLDISRLFYGENEQIYLDTDI